MRAWYETYGLPIVITNCSNNYGQYQFPEKLIRIIYFEGTFKSVSSIYGNGDNVRDWLYVDDHANALLLVLEKGRLVEVILVVKMSVQTFR